MDNSPDIKVLSVSELTKRIKGMLESSFVNLLVRGEISNFKAHSSGHWYFTLKDADAAISAVIWRSRAYQQQFMPREGQEVVAEGRLTLYEKGGRYQVDVNKLFLAAGKGDLYAEYEALKEKLKNEGLFDKTQKKPLPRIPEKIAVVTASTGAALRDILNVIQRRYPVAGIFLYPVPVQGKEAAPKIAGAINYLNKIPEFDVIILARGGGSIEDLWPFNEEAVARAIHASTIPVITGIGHETDFTIADFVADYRAPTPSAAAEVAVPHIDAIRDYLIKTQSRMRRNIEKTINDMANQVELYNERILRHSPVNRLRQHAQSLDFFSEKLNSETRRILNSRKERLARFENLLQSLSPNAILERGYALIRKKDKLVSSVNELEARDEVELILKDGNKKALIKG
jgi:exodeoxyribonuclease VII large subunit